MSEPSEAKAQMKAVASILAQGGMGFTEQMCQIVEWHRSETAQLRAEVERLRKPLLETSANLAILLSRGDFADDDHDSVRSWLDRINEALDPKKP